MGLHIFLLSCWPFPWGSAGERWWQRALGAESEELREACLRLAMGGGHQDACVLLGEDLARSGQGVGRQQALAYFQEAASHGHPVGAFDLAELIRWEFPGGRQGTAASFRWYEKSAEGGFEPAMRWLIHAWETGEGVEADLARAQAWRERMASPGPRVQWPPQSRHVHGVDRDLARPFRRALWHLETFVSRYATRPWYPFVLAILLILTLQGLFAFIGLGACGFALGVAVVVAFAISVLSGPYRRRTPLDRLTKSADAGDVDAMHAFGLVLRDGSPYLLRDRVKAKDYLLRAAEAGHVQAMVDLAELLRWGQAGHNPDLEGARMWIERARAAGHEGLPPGIETGVLPITPPAQPAFSEAEEKLAQWRLRMHQGFGVRVSRWLMVGLAAVMSLLLWRITYNNTGWLGRRDRMRVVWGDALNRVVAPKDPLATQALAVARRPKVSSFQATEADLDRMVPVDTASWQGSPAMLVFVRGRQPAFHEQLNELQILSARAGRKPSMGVVYIPEREDPTSTLLQLQEHFHSVRILVPDPAADLSSYGDLQTLPCTVVLDAQGRIRQRWVGYQPNLMTEAFQSALKE